jgi:hypothetical protein
MIQTLKLSTEHNKQILEACLVGLVSNIEENIDFYLNSKGVFIIVAIIENSDSANILRKSVEKSKKMIESLAQSSGVTALKELVFN